MNTDSIYKNTFVDTVYLRRIVTSGACKSNSNIFKINILPNISNNIIKDTDWVSRGNISKPIIGDSPTGGDKTYIYKWQQSTNKLVWANASGTITNTNYLVPLLNDTTYYRRIVYSGQYLACRDTSKNLPIYVLNPLSNNTISGVDTICALTAPQKLSGSLPSGGDNVYYYEWQISANKISWDSATTIQSLSFVPSALLSDAYFRRIVLSGRNYCCKDTSASIFVLVKPYIKNNLIINTDTTICFNQQPNNIYANLPVDGDGAYSYLWEDSVPNGNWTSILVNGNNQNYQPLLLYDTTFFRRKVISGVCLSYSDTLQVKVLPLIKNNLINSSQFVCYGQSPQILKGQQPTGGDGKNYQYQWFYSIDTVNWLSNINDTSINLQPGAIDTLTYYRRNVYSGYLNCCKDTSSQISMKILSLPQSILADFDTNICSDKSYNISIKLIGNPAFNLKYTNGYSTKTINNIFGSDTSFSFNSDSLGTYNFSITSLQDGNGCYAKSMIGSGKLGIFARPTPIAGVDSTSVCGLSVQLKAKTSYGIGNWSCSVPATYSNGIYDSINKANVGDYMTDIFTWTENNGGCIDSSSFHVTFYEQPPKPFAGNDSAGLFMFSTQLAASTPYFGSGRWSSADSLIFIQDKNSPNTIADSLKFGKNVFIWTVSNGVCPSAADTVVISNKDIRVPNGFSPNGDGINDYFEIIGLDKVKNAELIIMTKWGEVLYHSNNYDNKWDGTINGTSLNSDTYLFILHVLGRTYKGYVEIRR